MGHLLQNVDFRTRDDLGHYIVLLSGLDMIWVTALCWRQDSTWFGLRHCVDVRTRHDLGYCFMLMSGLDMIWVTAFCWCQDSTWFGLLHYVDVRTRHHLDYCIVLISGRRVILVIARSRFLGCKKIGVIALCWFQGAGWFWSLQNADRISGRITIWVKKSLALCYNFQLRGKWNQISPLESACTLCQSWPPTSHAPQRRQMQLTGSIKLIICGAARRWTKVIAGTMTYRLRRRRAQWLKPTETAWVYHLRVWSCNSFLITHKYSARERLRPKSKESEKQSDPSKSHRYASLEETI